MKDLPEPFDDIFGIGTAVRSSAEVYFSVARRSGRTTHLLNMLKDGDRVIFADAKQAGLFQRLAYERGKKIECVVAKIEDRFNLRDRFATSHERTFFDHVFIEEWYRLELRYVARVIERERAALSGWTEAHEQTRAFAKRLRARPEDWG